MKRHLIKSNKVIIEAYNKGYRVSNNGNLVNSIKGIVKTIIQKNGYKKFTIKSKEYGRYTVHCYRLQAYQKYGMEMFEDGICVRHLNGNSLDDSYDNIAIGTHSDNMMDIPKDVRVAKAMKAGAVNRRFTDKQVQEILIDRENGYTYKALCEKYDTSKSTLSYLFNHALYK